MPRDEESTASETLASNAGAAVDGPFSFLSRRKFLKLGLLAGGAIAAGLGGGVAALRGCAPEVDGLTVVSPHQHRTLRAIVDVLFPADNPAGVDVEAMRLPHAFDEFLAGEPEQNVSDLKAALTLVEFGPLVYDRRAVTFPRLEREERAELWWRWMTGEDLLRRKVTLAFRRFFNMVFYDHEEVWPYISYRGPSLQVLIEERSGGIEP